MTTSIQRFFANNHMEILVVTWYTLHLPMLILFITYNVGYYYFAALMVVSSGLYHLIKRKGNRKSLAAYYSLAIIGYLVVITLIINLKQPEPVISADQKSSWLIA